MATIDVESGNELSVALVVRDRWNVCGGKLRSDCVCNSRNQENSG